MHPRIQMFLEARDRASARQDVGMIRAMNAELRRFGVPDDATLAHPTGQPKRQAVASVATADAPLVKRGRPKLARCEHDRVAERCEYCNPELVAS